MFQNMSTWRIISRMMILLCYAADVCPLTCLHCTNVPKPRLCKTVTECDTGQFCGTEKVRNSFGEDVYNLGCLATSECVESGSGCVECCNTSLCNARGCGQDGYPPIHDRICYSCPLYTDSVPCHSIDFCSAGEVCMFETKNVFGDLVYSSRCAEANFCKQHFFGGAPLVGRALRKQSEDLQIRDIQRHVPCYGCCNDDLCNQQCNATDTIPTSAVSLCQSNPCFHGQCIDMSVDFVCNCDDGYTGKTCEQAVSTSYCTQSSCDHGMCYNVSDGFICKCDHGYEGKLCNISFNTCDPNPCVHGLCLIQNNSYSCICDQWFEGSHCETGIKQCRSSPCLHGQCYDITNDYVCVCNHGFEGKQCELSVHANYCSTHPCIHGQCYSMADGFICACSHGYEGKLCNTSVYPCTSNPCVHGRCIDKANSYTCICDQWFEGTNCEKPISHCRSNPCHHGTCYDITNDYLCVCEHGFEGKQCSNSSFACDADPCIIGNCTNVKDKYACHCDKGFYGVNCDKPTDCYDILHSNMSADSGIYNIVLWKSHRKVQVYCDMVTDGGGWTVFQSRFNGSVDFYRNFSQYEHGFGSLTGEFWLGLSYVQEMASQNNTELRLDLTAANGSTAYEIFKNFRLEDDSNYTLHIDRGTGTAGDSGNGLSYNNGYKFSTFDHDNTDRQCPREEHGGWWYRSCTLVNLNGEYITPGTVHSNFAGEAGVIYEPFQSVKSLKITQMKLRRI